ncbi:dTDP-Rha--alpha-D-GlcNAc-pyrophosphate polyprenol alpha-3-L-rhamnosyltransferase [Flavobacterium cyanobacteriorum]|uniref:dTDP-Rha--alpha-D-GlcNAc-pyrophosphate polyprenol alpha-3-L-rhamnosyltransferase n=1 Tax=Flavobacterium cyanobacteriorum TaxID=2022802 RepID=A0A255YRS4_9FLAO|nr:glycosyltransferase family 2 protein [Flavobacterium cyanobacteriorum]OYQ31881.1 dTDP-Rha--alpha-D-GlcNAc-pyrophosphate polyprenol alpha-3-L-rhamnosyltransferase [Flavobacterium cyanobacteriorum]
MNNIAVVILNWNGKKLLEEFLPSVMNHSPEAVIYVADNASTDDSVAFVTANFPDVKIIRNNGNYGYAGGYNKALEEVEEEYYALVNSDVEVTEGWLRPVLALFESDPETAIIQPKILDQKNKIMFEYAGAAGGFIDRFGYPFCRGRIFNTLEKDKGQYDDNTEIFWASGACFFIRRNVYRELKGFDEDFFAHQEEIDLCWRAFNLNYKIRFCGSTVIYHVGGATLSNTNPRKTYLNFRNSLLMMTKNLPSGQLLPVLFLRLCLDGLAGVQFLLQGKLSHIMAIIKAHFSFYALFSKFLSKRESKQYRNYYKINSIVIKYYVLNGRIFDKNI